MHEHDKNDASATTGAGMVMYDDDDGLLFSMSGIESEPVNNGMMSQSCHTGQMAEMKLGVEAAQRGYGVFFPIGHSHKADLIIWMPPNQPLSIQVKKATWQRIGDSFKFMIGSGKPSCQANPNDYGKRYTKYEKGDFDFLCAYIEELNEFIFYRLDDIAGKSSMRWRPGEGKPSGNWHDLK